jgi:hypothetical protein
MVLYDIVQEEFQISKGGNFGKLFFKKYKLMLIDKTRTNYIFPIIFKASSSGNPGATCAIPNSPEEYVTFRIDSSLGAPNIATDISL